MLSRMTELLSLGNSSCSIVLTVSVITSNKDEVLAVHISDNTYRHDIHVE